MKLSMSILADHLSDYDIRCQIQNDHMTISGIRFLSEQPDVSSLEYVYIGNAGSFFQDPQLEDSMILANGKNNIICRGTDYTELLNRVLSAFDFYNHFEQELYLASQQGLPLASMLRILQQVLPDPLLVFSIEGELLGRSNDKPLPHNILTDMSGTVKKIIAPHSMGISITDVHGRISHDLSHFAQIMYQNDYPQVHCVSRYLLQDNERIGFIMNFSSTPVRELKSCVIEDFIAPFLSQAAEFHSADSLLQSDHSALKQLLSGQDIPAEIARRLEQRLAFRSLGRLLLLRPLSIRNHTMRRVLMDSLENQSFSCLTCEYEDTIAILTEEESLAALTAHLQRQIPAKNFSMGISMPLHGLDGLQKACHQAQFALNQRDKAGIRYCQDLALPHMLQLLCKDPENDSLLHPALEILQRYDKEHKTDLYQTLCTYLYHNLIQIDTAQQMHIHLNTLKYRLRKIEDLSHVNFKNFNEVFYLQLSAKLVNEDTTFSIERQGKGIEDMTP